MIFDKACGIAERYLPELANVLRQCKLFVYDKPAHEILEKEIERERAIWLQENFFLPFPTIAVEDPASCMILKDLTPDAKGLGVTRTFFEIIPLVGDPDAFVDSTDEFRALMHKLRHHTDLVSITGGRIAMKQDDERIGTGFTIEGSVNMAAAASKDKGVIDYMENPPEIAAQAALRNASASIQEVMLLNSPDRFVLEIEPANLKKRENAPKIPRSHERARYVLLKPNEIRRVMKLPQPEGDRQSPRPHERRRHTRTFRSERYVSAQGKTIIVPATWVGPSENVHGGQKYKVMLDL